MKEKLVIVMLGIALVFMIAACVIISITSDVGELGDGKYEDTTISENYSQDEEEQDAEVKVTIEPFSISSSEITTDSTATVDPAATVDPNATVDPTATTDLNATTDPAATTDPNATTDPAATVDPAATIDPNATDMNDTM